MTSGVEKSSDKRKRERSGDERYIEAKGSEAVVDGDRCKKKMYKEEREKDRGKEVRKEERKEGRGRTKQKKRSETRCVPVCERNGVQKPKLQDVQLQARLDERRDCQRRQQKALSLPSPFFSSWISSNSSKRLTRPVALSLSLFYSAPSRGTRTILSMIAEEDFTSISPRNLQLRTQMIRLRRDAIIEMSFPAENKCLLPSSDFLLPVSVF